MAELHRLGCVGFKGFMCFATEAYPRISDGYLMDGMREAASFGGLIALHAENAEAADLGCKHYSELGCKVRLSLTKPGPGGRSMMPSSGRCCLPGQREPGLRSVIPP